MLRPWSHGASWAQQGWETEQPKGSNAAAGEAGDAEDEAQNRPVAFCYDGIG